MSEEWDDIEKQPEEPEEQEEQLVDETAADSGKFSRLLGDDSRKFKLSGMFKDWFLDYASYVILQRAVPHIVDGLKPVQRRVLHAMYKMDDGRYTKVANIVGQAMQYHPHGDASILGALVQLGQKGFAVDCQGNWGNILQNCKTALECDPVLKNSIRKNLLTGQTDLVNPVYWHRSGNMLTDTDQKNIELRLENCYHLTSEKKIAKAVSIVANENQYHPVRDYLSGLVWDGTPRIRFALHHFLGADVSDFNEECLRVFMLGAAHRAFQPGCKFELMLCLVGGQGAGKSSFFRLLAVRDEWFSDDLKKLDDEIVYRKLQGHWIIEMSEMIATASARSIEEIKAFISRQKETYKIPYEVHPEDRPRQCVFAGTTNRLDFLPRDRTGNRRFLPIPVNPELAEAHPLSDEAAARKYIDQMWAEIMTLYRSGEFSLRLSAESEKTLCANQKDFVQEDVWAGMIYAYFQDCRDDYLCSRQLYMQALLKGNDPDIRETREICEIVNTGIASGEITGWKPLKNPRRFGEYGTQRGWERVNKTPAPEVNTKQFSFFPVNDPDCPF